eukprot:SAG31_NODE_3212_length_4544_cov_1.849719_1_plen_219_part_10
MVFGGIHRLDLTSQQWEVIKCSDSIGNARYSHAAVHLINHSGLSTEKETHVLMLGGFDVTRNSSTTSATVCCQESACYWKDRLQLHPATSENASSELLLLRHEAVQLWPGGPIVCIGGGAGCFSFGTHNNAGVVAIRVGVLPATPHPARPWRALYAPSVNKPISQDFSPKNATDHAGRQILRRLNAATISTCSAFQDSVVQKRVPVVITGSYGDISSGD